MGEIIDAKSSYEHTRRTEPEGHLLPPWEELSLSLRIAFINTFNWGGKHALDLFAAVKEKP